nr:hypothetical protein [Tanacetum cinerariifolium]
MIELRGTFQAWLQQRKYQVVNLDSYSPKPLQCWKIPIYYDDDDDKESSTPLRDIIISELHSCIEITPFLSTEEPNDSFISGDEHIDTISEKELDEFIKSSVENLVPNPSESKDERECYIDSLLDEFTGELIFLKSIPPGIDEADCDPKEEIRLIKKLLYEEIDLSLTPDDSIPLRIENDDYDSERDILILEELLSIDSLSLPENESFHFDVPSSPRPLAKLPDDGIDFKPDSGSLTVKWW